MNTMRQRMSLTLIFLSKHFGEVERVFDSLVPHLRFKCKFDLGHTLCHWRKLEEITGDDDLALFRVPNQEKKKGTEPGFLRKVRWTFGACYLTSPACRTDRHLP
jgi:hypothetical protein